MIEIIYRCDPEQPDRARFPTNAEEARLRLESGNREFAHLLERSRSDHTGKAHASCIVPLDLEDLGLSQAPGTAAAQKPFAIVLGCSDARVPTELIFNQACNSLFVVRVAGSVLGTECLGSVDYALNHLSESIRLVVCLGHSGCGAVTAAVDAFLEPARFLSEGASQPLRSIVDRLLLCVRAAANGLERRWGPGVTAKPGYRRALIEAAIVANVMLNAVLLKHEFRHRMGEGLQVVSGVLDLVTHHVRMPVAGDDHTGDAEIRLFSPGTEPEDMASLGMRVAGSEVMRALLEG